MLQAIKHGLSNLTQFSGRDARQAFWYYVLFIYILSVVLTMIVVIPIVVEAVSDGFQAGMAAAQSNDPAAGQILVQQSVMQSMQTMMSTMITVSGIINLVMTVALAAAFVRRLHDSGLAGWWGLIPLVIQVANFFAAPRLMRQMMETMNQVPAGDPTASIRAMQGSMGFASLLGWVAILVFVILGARKSNPGPNRFGAEPFIA